MNLPLPTMRRRRADITFVHWRTAVFVQGCFWHACPEHLHAPKHNAEWWWRKLDDNTRRDRDTDATLLRLGWHPLRVWEHEAVEDAVHKVVEVLAYQGHPRARRLHQRFGLVNLDFATQVRTPKASYLWAPPSDCHSLRLSPRVVGLKGLRDASPLGNARGVPGRQGSRWPAPGLS